MSGQGPGPEPTAQFYDRLAQVYDRLFAYPPAHTARQAAWLARVCPRGRLLDLGCGTGRMLAPLAEAGFTPVGLDCSAGMLGQARAAHPRVDLVRAEASQALPFAGQSFRAVVSLHGSLSHVIDEAARRRLAQEAHRVLTPGGVLVVELPHPRSFPPPGPPGSWRRFRPGMSCRRVATDLEEFRLDALDGITAQVAVLDLAQVGRWLAMFAMVQAHPGFSGGAYDPEKGAALVVCAYK